MKYIDLLGHPLKDPNVIDVLETGDLEVIYSFDRLNENQPDAYWVESRDEGVQMRFDEDQILDTLFFYIEPDEGFSRCAQTTMGIPVFNTLQAAKQHAESSGHPSQEGETDFLGIHRKWIKIDFGDFLHHSEFQDSRLHRVTAMRRPKTQQASAADADKPSN